MPYPVSDEFKAAVRRSHTRVARAELLSEGSKVADLDVSAGHVTADLGRKVRRTCNLNVVPTDNVPSDLGSDIAPNGNEVRIFRGVNLSTGIEEAPLGVFRIADVDTEDNASKLTLKVKGRGRSDTVARSRFSDTYVVSSGTSVEQAIRDIVGPRVNGVLYNFDGTNRTTPRLVYEAGDNPWEACEDIAASAGREVYFDASGVCVLRSVPDYDSKAATREFYEGDGGALLRVDRKLVDGQTYSRVVVTGEGSEVETPVRAEAADESPSSPTYVNGAFGDVPRFYTSSMIDTESQAQEVADAMLRRYSGYVERVAIEIVPDPSMDVGDVVHIKRSRSKVDGRHVVERIRVPLSKGPMKLKLRKRRD